jgi:hypothetical protein
MLDNLTNKIRVDCKVKLEDMDFVQCWNNDHPLQREYRFYDKCNDSTFDPIYYCRNGESFDNYQIECSFRPYWFQEELDSILANL